MGGQVGSVREAIGRRLSIVGVRLYAYIYLRGFKVWASYRTQIVLNVLSWVLPVFTYYFTGTALGARIVTPQRP